MVPILPGKRERSANSTACIDPLYFPADERGTTIGGSFPIAHWSGNREPDAPAEILRTRCRARRGIPPRRDSYTKVTTSRHYNFPFHMMSTGMLSTKRACCPFLTGAVTTSDG
jgi:hypothetical protein